MSEDDAEVFEIYVNWLYRGVIICDCLELNDKPYDQRQEQWRLLIEAYRFGDKILHYAFMNKVIDEIATLHGVLVQGQVQRFDHENVELVYGHNIQETSVPP